MILFYSFCTGLLIYQNNKKEGNFQLFAYIKTSILQKNPLFDFRAKLKLKGLFI